MRKFIRDLSELSLAVACIGTAAYFTRRWLEDNF